MLRILYGDIELASSDLAKGRVGPVGLTVNGRQIVDAAEFFRALTTTYFGRGARSVDLAFGVRRLLPSVAAALRFQLMHHGDLPDEGDLVFVVDDLVVALPGAVLDAAERGEWQGLATTVRYTLRGSAFEVREDIPPETDPSMLRRANVAIPSGATSVAVVFTTPLSGVPFVQCSLLMPTAGGDAIFATLREDTISATGFTADLSGPTPGAGYKLSYRAEL